MARPSKYDPSMCDTIIQLGKDGKSKAQMMVEIGICKDTWHRWDAENKEFSDAVKEAMLFSQAWWEEKGRIHTFDKGEGFNPTSYIFNMKNRFSDDWRDKVESDHTSSDGTMSPVTEVVWRYADQSETNKKT